MFLIKMCFPCFFTKYLENALENDDLNRNLINKEIEIENDDLNRNLINEEIEIETLVSTRSSHIKAFTDHTACKMCELAGKVEKGNLFCLSCKKRYEI